MVQEILPGADLQLEAAATTRLDDVGSPAFEDYPYGPFWEKQCGRYLASSERAIGELF